MWKMGRGENGTLWLDVGDYECYNKYFYFPLGKVKELSQNKLLTVNSKTIKGGPSKTSNLFCV